MEYVFSFIALLGFAYFIYTRVEQAKERQDERADNPVEPRPRPRDDRNPPNIP